MNINLDLHLVEIHIMRSLVDYIINFFDNYNISCGIFLHISKAFDTMDHSILLGRHLANMEFVVLL